MTVQYHAIQVLVIEGNPEDKRLVEGYLKDGLGTSEIAFAKTVSHAKKRLKNDYFDIIILDTSLDDGYEEELLNTTIQLAGFIPIIVLTDHEKKDFGVKALALGAADFLLKNELDASRLGKSILYSIERNKLVNRLRSSEEKYKKMFDYSPSPMWVYHTETLQVLDVNMAAIIHYGYSRDEFLKLTLHDLRPEQDLGAFEEAREKYSSRRAFVSYPYHFRHKKKNGTIIHVDIQSSSFDFEGEDSRLVLATDISAKVEAERVLRLNEQRFRALVQDGADLIAILDPEGNYKYVSPSAKTILGISSDELLGKSAFDLIHLEDMEIVLQHFNLVKDKKRVQVPPFRFRDSENNWRWIETKATNMMDDPAIEGIIANSRDVTATIENEIKLKESVARYNLVAKATKDVIWDWDLVEKKITWNDGIRAMFGYKEDQINLEDNWWKTKVHPQDIDRVLLNMEHHIKNKILKWQDEYRFQGADGTYKYVFNRGFLVIDQSDKPVRMLGAMQDITRKKNEEQHLKLLESVITNATESVMVTDAESIDAPGPKIIYVNNAFTKMSGYSREETIGQSPRFLQGKNTDRTALDKLRESLAAGESCEVELINYKKNGEEYWVQMEIAPVADDLGRITHFIAIQRDVTERKNYIQAIEDQNKKLGEIAWLQSHIVRAPLARIMGLINFLTTIETQEEKDTLDVLGNVFIAANELDGILRKIVSKAEQVNIIKSNEAESTDS